MRIRPSVIQQAEADLDGAEVSQEDLRGDRKVQTKGAQGAINATVSEYPVLRTEVLDLSRVIIREGYERSKDEYRGIEWEDFKASFGDGLNSQPVDVREVVNPAGLPKGVYYELLAGYRRRQALLELERGRIVVAVRECDERAADRVHALENRGRKNKSLYSEARALLHMYQARNADGSKRYATMLELARNVGWSDGYVSQHIAVIEDAPSGMWEALDSPSSILSGDIALLIRAFKVPGFRKEIEGARSLTRQSLVGIAKRHTAKKKKGPTAAARVVGEVRRGDHYHFVLPAKIDPVIRLSALDLVNAFVESESVRKRVTDALK